MKRLFTTMSVMFSLLVVAGGARGEVQYTVSRLNPLPDSSYTLPIDINASGQIVGMSFASGYSHCVLYSNGTVTDLGLDFWPTAMNASGQVIGQLYGIENTAYLYSNGTLTNIGTLPGSTMSHAHDINDSGQVVGFSWAYGVGGRAFIYSNGTMRYLREPAELDDFPVAFDATAINASGQVVGLATNGDGQSYAYLYSGGVMIDLGTIPPESPMPLSPIGINASGQVVGNFYPDDSDSRRAFLYTDGTITDLGTLPGGTGSLAEGINASGQVIGISFGGEEGNVPFVYANGVMTDLNSLIDPTSGWTLIDATAINDAGQIVGLGLYGGYAWGVVLTPVPEPAGFALLMIGGISALGYACRRHISRLSRTMEASEE